MSEPERLSGELEELLQAERDIDAPPPEKRAQLLARLGPLVIPGAIGAGVGAAAAGASSGAETAATGKAAGALGAGLKAKLVVAAIAGAVGALGGAATEAAITRARVTELAPAISVSARGVPPSPAATVSAPPAAELATSAEASARPAPSAPATTRAGGSGAATLRTERLLLERASAALMRGDSGSALDALREHARRFPHGELAEEREVLLVRALRASGQSDAAQKRAQDFKRRFPSSLQQGTIDETPSSP